MNDFNKHKKYDMDWVAISKDKKRKFSEVDNFVQGLLRTILEYEVILNDPCVEIAVKQQEKIESLELKLARLESDFAEVTDALNAAIQENLDE